MFDGKKENQWAIEEFCNKPIAQALQLYHEIKRGLGAIDKPIGPLYTTSQAHRDFVMQTLNPWYYSYPFVAIAIKEKVDSLDADLRQYFDGITMHVVPYDKGQDCAVCRGVTCGMPPLIGGATGSRGAIAGATCTWYEGMQCICAPPLLNFIMRSACCGGISMRNMLCSSFCCKVLRRSQKKTL